MVHGGRGIKHTAPATATLHRLFPPRAPPLHPPLFFPYSLRDYLVSPACRCPDDGLPLTYTYAHCSPHGRVPIPPPPPPPPLPQLAQLLGADRAVSCGTFGRLDVGRAARRYGGRSATPAYGYHYPSSPQFFPVPHPVPTFLPAFPATITTCPHTDLHTTGRTHCPHHYYTLFPTVWFRAHSPSPSLHLT